MKVEKFHNWELDRAIRESGQEAQEIAKAAGVDPATFSNIKRGRMRPTDEEERSIAGVLNMPISKLFVRFEVAETV